MAHFARVENGIVIAVHLVNNDAIDKNDEEKSGSDFLNALYNLNAQWVQTSYNGRIRYNYAGIGYVYDSIRDAFIAPKPNCGHAELVLTPETLQWNCDNADHSPKI